MLAWVVAVSNPREKGFGFLTSHYLWSKLWASLEQIKMDSQEQFKKTIHEHYKRLVPNEFPEELLNRVVTKLAVDFHNQYSRFKKQYTKSTKRYSKFHVKDLDHPQTFESIIEFLKTSEKSDYKKYAGKLLNLNES